MPHRRGPIQKIRNPKPRHRRLKIRRIRIHLRHGHRDLPIPIPLVAHQFANPPGHPLRLRPRIDTAHRLDRTARGHRLGLLAEQVGLNMPQCRRLGKSPRRGQYHRRLDRKFAFPKDPQQLRIRLLSTVKQSRRVQHINIRRRKVKRRRIQTQGNIHRLGVPRQFNQQLPLLHRKSRKPIHPNTRPPQKLRLRDRPPCQRHLHVRILQPARGLRKKRRIPLKHPGNILPFSCGRTARILFGKLFGQLGNLPRPAIGLLKLGQQPAQPRRQPRLPRRIAIQHQRIGQLQQHPLRRHLTAQPRQLRPRLGPTIQPKHQPVKRQHPQPTVPRHARPRQHQMLHLVRRLLRHQQHQRLGPLGPQGRRRRVHTPRRLARTAAAKNKLYLCHKTLPGCLPPFVPHNRPFFNELPVKKAPISPLSTPAVWYRVASLPAKRKRWTFRPKNKNPTAWKDLASPWPCRASSSISPRGKNV